MTNQKIKLHPKMFAADVPQRPTRDGYGEGLLLAGQENENVVVLCADLSESTRSLAFQEQYPGRYFELGVAEQNMAAVAAGFGVSGKCAFISSYAVFSPGRNWEQLRTTVCYNNSNVKIAGAHAGVSVGPDGATHQALEDVALMRVLPNMKVIVPCDAEEAKKATLSASRFYGPAYLRFAREKTPVMTTDATPFTVGKAEVFWESKNPQVLIVGCGPLLYQALLAARELERQGVGSVVLNSHTVKPLDKATILKYARLVKRVLTVEEHQQAGGLGSAVSEFLSRDFPVPMDYIGVADTFGQSGTPEELLEFYGLTAPHITEKALRLARQ